MAKIVQLTNVANEQIFPITSAQCVFLNDSRSVQQALKDINLGFHYEDLGEISPITPEELHK